MMPRNLYSPAKRRVYKVCVFTALLIVIAFAATIPFIWESKSMWYKIGADKTLLQAGKVAGIAAAILLFFQILLAIKIRFFDSVFGLDRLYQMHKRNGLVILTLAVMHASLIILPEGVENLPIGWKFWPEMLGAAILLSLILFIGTALLRRRLMPYHLWRKMHRPMGYLFVIALSVHIFNVSDSFEDDIPNYALWVLISTLVLVVTATKIRSLFSSRRRLAVQNCNQVKDDILSLTVDAPSSFTHAPGQFAFLRLYGNDISPEPHPFTISSAPAAQSNQDATLQFFIKNCGDWTNNLSPGKVHSAAIEGPFGLFSYKANTPSELLVFIAGGIGITPLLSMLRQLSCEENPPRLMLLWCLSWKRDMFLDDELKSLQDMNPHLQVRIWYTREQGGRRLDQELLAQLLGSVPPKTQFYICGPETMIVQTKKNIQDLGFAAKNIFAERFVL